MSAPEIAGIPFPRMPQQYDLVRDVPDHELLMVFNSDDHAELFRNWLEDSGWEAFGEYAQANGGAS